MTHEEFQKTVESIPATQLVEMAEKAVSKLCKTGAKSFTMSIPPKTDDTDIILTEIIRRFKEKKNTGFHKKRILLVWQGYNETTTGNFVDIPERTVVYLDTKPIWAQLEKDIEAYKNRIRVLETLNNNYREKLGIENLAMDLDLISPIVENHLISEIFEPTVNLRFQEREVIVGKDNVQERKILQQLYKGSAGTYDWRDVEVVAEPTEKFRKY